MPSFEPLAIFMSIFRMVPAIIFILFMLIMFFSLKVTVRNTDMERFNMELSDALSGTGLASDYSVFSAKELAKAETEKKDLEIYARSCDYGYALQIDSLAGKTYCSNDEGCRSFCDSVCGQGSECDCNFELFSKDFCECKKDGRWIQKHNWIFGYKKIQGYLSSVTTELPSSIDSEGEIILAKLILTTYGSALTRMACMVQKAYETKRRFSMPTLSSVLPEEFYYPSDQYMTPVITFRRTDADGTHVCFYAKDESGNDVPYDCRYMPDVPFKDLEVTVAELSKIKYVSAYPLKTDTDSCDDVIKNPDNFVAGEGDEVTAVILCLER